MPQAVCRAGAVHSKFAGLAPAFFGFHRRHALNAPDKLAQFLQLTREPLPASSKRYLTGSRADIRVPLRDIALTNGERVSVYDTSGPYTDSNAVIDVRQGLASVRGGWITGRGAVER